jgi:aldose 1-epimerase
MKKNRVGSICLLVILFIFNLSCSFNNSNKNGMGAATITTQHFGTFEGKPITEYTLTNATGIQVGIINYGGIITKIITQAKDSSWGDVVTGYDSLAGYTQKDNPYFGALIGRYANRLAKGKYTIDGVDYSAALNNNGHSLHGGLKGFDKVVWEAAILPGDSSIQLNYLSQDGEEGYPGNLKVQVVYTLMANNAIKIEYTASTDKTTILNLTNHAYFNLTAGKSNTIYDHLVQINANKFTPVDASLIPTGELLEVKGTPMDFTTAKKVGQDIDQVMGGYDHNWVLNKADGLQEVASVYEPISGRYLTVATTEPGLQFYTGNFLDGTLKGTKKGVVYNKHYALTLETQHFPDSPNQPGFPSTLLQPGETYHQTTVFTFSTK